MPLPCGRSARGLARASARVARAERQRPLRDELSGWADVLDMRGPVLAAGAGGLETSAPGQTGPEASILSHVHSFGRLSLDSGRHASRRRRSQSLTLTQHVQYVQLVPRPPLHGARRLCQLQSCKLLLLLVGRLWQLWSSRQKIGCQRAPRSPTTDLGTTTRSPHHVASLKMAEKQSSTGAQQTARAMRLLCPRRRLGLLQLLLLLLLAAAAVAVATSAWSDDSGEFFDGAEPLPLERTAAAFPPLAHTGMGRSPAAAAVYGERALSAELPSLQQRRALATDSPALLLARARSSESLVALDGLVARVGGTGRVGRPSGISITRGLPLTSPSLPPEAHDERLPVDATAITFRDAVLRFGTVRTCEPQLHFVEIINTADVDVRLYALEFTRTGFEVLTDVHGTLVRAHRRRTIEVLLTPSEPEPRFEAFMRVFTSSGLFALRITGSVVLHPLGFAGISAVVPVATAFTATLTLQNPFETSVRVFDVFARDPIGSFSIHGGASALAPPARAQAGGPRTDMWDVAPGTAQRIVDYTLHSQRAGVFTTYVRMTTSSELEVAIPVVVEVVPEGLHVEPARVDLGVLTTMFDTLREVHVDLFNAAAVPIKVLGVHVAETNMDVTATLSGPVVVPPKTRIRHALTVELRTSIEGDAECYAVLKLQTNVSSSSSSSELVVGDLRLSGVQLSGTIAYDLPSTLVGVRISTADMVRDGSGETDEASAAANAAGSDPDEDVARKRSSTSTNFQLEQLMTAEVFANGESMSVEPGVTIVRSLRLKNLFSIPLELEDVWVSSDTDGVVAVDHFETGLALSGEYWPGEIRLRIAMPRHKDDSLRPRAYIVRVDTNMVHFQLTVHVFYGFLQVTAESDQTNSLATTGYLPAMAKNRSVLPTRCFSTVDEMASSNSSASDSADAAADTAVPDHGFLKLCRTVLMDLGKVSQRGVRSEVLKLSNINAIPINMRIAQVLSSDAFDFKVTSVLAEGSEVSPEVVAVGREWAKQLERPPDMDLFDSTRESDRASNTSWDPSIEMPPGHDLVMMLALRVGEWVGERSAYLLTIETEFEFIHVFARFESVEGTIAPVVPEIETAPLFAGSAAYVDVLFTNTFGHDVQVSALSFPGSSVQVVTTTKFLPAQATHIAFSLLFSPGYHDDCQASKYLADCLLPRLQVHALANPLSDYGDLVSFNDLIQFERRQAAWRAIERTGGETHRIEAVMQLHTAIMDPEPIRIVAPLARPSVTTANLSEALTVCRFPLVKVMERSQATVRVRNPSSIAVDMELAIGFHEHALFYRCDKSVSEATCLAQWEAVVVEGARHANQSAPPFFLASRVVRVPWGEEVELGPVYFFPSLVREYDTMLYVRNELTHVEPVQLYARSGTGSLAVRAQTEEAKSSDAGAKLFHESGAALSGDSHSISDSPNDSVVVRFEASSAASDAGFASRSRAITLTNVGDFELTIERVVLRHDASASVRSSPYSVHVEKQREDHTADRGSSRRTGQEDFSPVVLRPGASVTARVEYEPNCLVSKAEETLEIVAANVTTRVKLVAELHRAAAFACLRAKVPAAVLTLARALWGLSVCVAVLVSLSSVYLCARNLLLVYRRERLLRSPAAPTSARASTTADAMPDELDVAEVVNDTHHAALCRRLDELQASAYVADARVETPAVARLLAEREKRSLAAPKPPSQQQRRSDTQPANGDIVKTPPTPPAVARSDPVSTIAPNTNGAVQSAMPQADPAQDSPVRTIPAASLRSTSAVPAKALLESENGDTVESASDSAARAVATTSSDKSGKQGRVSAPVLGLRKLEAATSGVDAPPRASPTTSSSPKPRLPLPPSRASTPSPVAATASTSSSRTATPSPSTGARSTTTTQPEAKAESKSRRKDEDQLLIPSPALASSSEGSGIRPSVKPTMPGKLKLESGADSLQRSPQAKKKKKRATASPSPRTRRPVSATEAVGVTHSETKAAEVTRSKKPARPSSGKGGGRKAGRQERDDERVSASLRMRLSGSPTAAKESDGATGVDNPESVDSLASSMDSTSTAMSFDSVDSKDTRLSSATTKRNVRQQPATVTASAGTGDSLFLSTTFEAPFGSIALFA
ncbi:hypothetical protein PybrP1_003486 [[Pythium] brassicae (nom. inval.)]|nr:hypothetical protein PybrP1_003486 [[Pythium] brassicae (nom. inval.)]